MKSNAIAILVAVVGLVLGTSFVVVHEAFACSIPVFRYALQFWEPDPYELYVFHEGELTADDASRTKRIEEAARVDAGPNIVVRLVDLSGPVDDLAHAVWEKQTKRAEDKSETSLPRVVVRYPVSYRLNDLVDSSSLETFDLETWLDSPARREIASRLAKGETAVWVLLESGDKERDTAAAETLDATIQKLKSSLSLPAPAEEDDVLRDLGLQVASEVRIAFSTLRIAQGDPREKQLVKQLIGSEEDLRDLADQPMVFAVFGRGRMLPALVGGGITTENIHGMGEFLCGPCSCQVKTENPGVDLLFSVDWRTLLMQANEAVAKEAKTLASGSAASPSDTNLLAGVVPAPTQATDGALGTTTSGTTEAAATLVARAPTTDGTDTSSDSLRGGRPVFQNVLLLAALGLAVLLIGTVILTKKAS